MVPRARHNKLRKYIILVPTTIIKQKTKKSCRTFRLFFPRQKKTSAIAGGAVIQVIKSRDVTEADQICPLFIIWYLSSRREYQFHFSFLAMNLPSNFGANFLASSIVMQLGFHLIFNNVWPFTFSSPNIFATSQCSSSALAEYLLQQIKTNR